MNKKIETFISLGELAERLREELKTKKYILLYAYNGTGKTRLAMGFKGMGRQGTERDTLYFNAFTEDLFTWDNDLEDDQNRLLKINKDSHFFDGLEGMEMETHIRPLLHRYVDFDFRIDTEGWRISFSREEQGVAVDNIKISRGEENIFIWCFFLAIVQLAIDGTEAYSWVKYIYIDDPISSLDESNAISVASHLAQLLKKDNHRLKTVISSHHTLFFNVMCNELGKANRYFLSTNKTSNSYFLQNTGDTPFFYHVAMLAQLYEVAKSGKIYTYHFNILRSILEKTASFHGFSHFSACIKRDANDIDGRLHQRLVDLLSHGGYSLYEPVEMLPENKEHFTNILEGFLSRYSFNPDLFPEASEVTETP